MQKLNGIHHVTAITGDGQRITDFYCGVLGLRLVKKTVNFDDPNSYHLYFGDRLGSPGTLITFFVWPGASQGSVGAGEATAVAYGVAKGSLPLWKEKLGADQESRHGKEFLLTRDPDGMAIELVEGEEHRIHSVTLSERNPEATASLLTNELGIGLGDDGCVNLVKSEGARGRMGAGTIHHVAFRTANDEDQRQWLEHVGRLGLHVSPVMDRKYFHSIYFREPGGALFEIATDPPGMTVDEPVEHLGEKLMLPAEYERQRPHLEATLAPIRVPRPLEARA